MVTEQKIQEVETMLQNQAIDNLVKLLMAKDDIERKIYSSLLISCKMKLTFIQGLKA
jgi:hypothetical protein